MNNITDTLKKGIECCDNYSNDILKVIDRLISLNEIKLILDDVDSHWYCVLQITNGEYVVSAYFSQYFPVALILSNCREDILDVFKTCNVITTKFEEPFECDEEILKKYAPDITILDDRFLNDINFNPEDERMYYIYNNIEYVTPYNFVFDEIC